MDARYSGQIRRSVNGLRVNRRTETNKSMIKAVKLMFCLGVLVLTFLLKLLFPGLSSDIKSKVLPVLENSVDYRAAFSSMGKFFTGKEQFTKAFGDMVAFLVTGEDAVKAGAGDGAGIQGTGISDATVSDAGSEQEDAGLYISREALDKLSGLYRDQDGLSQPGVEVPVSPGIPVGPDEQAAAEPVEEDSSVEDFLRAQSAFADLEIPADVNAEKLDLPFEYEYPVKEAIVSSGFGYRRHPIDGVTKFHYGIDYDASIGDDIYAFTEGEVLVSGESESLGLYLIISHPEGFITQYFHCDKLSVHGGDHVTKGMKIAEVGETGKTTGPHLHFELLKNGFYLNPEYYLGNGD